MGGAGRGTSGTEGMGTEGGAIKERDDLGEGGELAGGEVEGRRRAGSSVVVVLGGCMFTRVREEALSKDMGGELQNVLHASVTNLRKPPCTPTVHL
jgi:hypothetical protein